VTQDAESQDAVSSKVESDVDNTADNVESNDFNTTLSKAALDNGITVSNISNNSPTANGPDTTNFPKTITLVYNLSDTINGEHITQTGTVTITVNVPSGKKPWRNFITRTVTFANFKVTTDSSSFTTNGTRTIKRISVTTTPNPIVQTGASTTLSKTVTIVDSITSSLTFNILYGTVNDTVTRIVNRTRTSVLNYVRAAMAIPANANIHKWIAIPKLNTVTLNGTVTGRNAKGSAYTRLITTPLVGSFCQHFPYNPMLAGVMTLTIGSDTPFTITYVADAADCKTTATITRNGVTKPLNRKLSLSFKKWW
jgi:hypothetical protein